MPALSIIVPTFNEVGNIRALFKKVESACAAISWEIIFVDDDSPDKTWEEICMLANSDHRVRCIHRVGRRGLSSACIEGMLASSAPIVAVMDADLQHDERLLPQMLESLTQQVDLDIVVGSRYVTQGGLGNWDAKRVRMSQFATRIGRLVLKADLKDPMSGFFMIRRQAAMTSIRNGMSAIGFKILLDFFASAPVPLRFKEIPFVFKNRHSGESKLDTNVAWEYLLMLVNHLMGGIVPVRFIGFTLVGGLGIVIHLATFSLLFKGLNVNFMQSQILATFAAMTCNFVMNNILTYRDMRLRGLLFIKGWLSFTLTCSVGAVANVGLSRWFFEQTPDHWLLSVLAGILVGAVWNYAITSVYTWKKPS